VLIPLYPTPYHSSCKATYNSLPLSLHTYYRILVCGHMQLHAWKLTETRSTSKNHTPVYQPPQADVSNQAQAHGKHEVHVKGPHPAVIPTSNTTTRPKSPTVMPYGYRATLNPAQLIYLLSWLPLPPDSTHPYWENRCFDCFAYGNQATKYRTKVVCRKCLRLTIVAQSTSHC
jgi:hypothetical protein